MPAKAYVRRVGGLAVTLGVGAAIVSGWGSGPAWADESGGTPGSTASSTASGTEPAPANPSAAQGTARSGDTGTTTTTSTTSPVTKDDEERSSPPVVVVGTGGLTRDPPASPTETSPTETAVNDGPTSKPTTKEGSNPAPSEPTKTRTPAPISTVADAKHDATAKHDETTDAVGTNPVGDPAERNAGAESPQIAATQSLSVATTSTESTAGPTPKPVPHLVTAVMTPASGFINAIFSPFVASNMPGAPATPFIWSLLAFARREFDRAFTTPSLTDKPVDAQTTSETRTLVLTAFPAEADAILGRTTLDSNPVVVVDGRHFYLGSIGGKKVIVAMTGIGMVNATQTTETALDYFTGENGISIVAVVFSGVAGGSGHTEIGDVAIPARWTSDDGTTWRAVDPGMLAAAKALTVDLDSTATLGNPACLCGSLARFPLVDLGREPQLIVGGDGSSDDNNNGVAFPSIPLGGDVFGPQPCTAPDFSPLFFGNFFQAVGPFLAFGLLSNLTGLLNPVVPTVDAVDQETAAAQQVADAHGVPFLGIRGMSDGPGDPLNLPGYPFTFFVYRQIAADNAAIVTEAFLRSWAEAPQPTA
jgi:nucleoside phosphorylase